MAFTYTWNTITAGMVDADSPGNETLFQYIRRNQIHLREWMGQSYYAGAASDHDNDGTNSKPVAGVGAGAVDIASLKRACGTVGGGAGGNFVLPGGYYGFYPSVKIPHYGWTINAHIASGGVWFAYRANIWLDTAVFAYQCYVQASPPYTLGNRLWNHFLFVLRRKSDGKVMGAYEAPDPPWANNGPRSMPKNSPDRIAANPHPFIEFLGKESSLDGVEITLIDLSEMDIERWITDCEKRGCSIIEELKFINGKKLNETFNGLPNSMAIIRGV